MNDLHRQPARLLRLTEFRQKTLPGLYDHWHSSFNVQRFQN
jgi:hypothetical protein